MAITQESIRSDLVSFLAVKMGIEVPSPEADLVATGLLDSPCGDHTAGVRGGA